MPADVFLRSWAPPDDVLLYPSEAEQSGNTYTVSVSGAIMPSGSVAQSSPRVFSAAVAVIGVLPKRVGKLFFTRDLVVTDQ